MDGGKKERAMSQLSAKLFEKLKIGLKPGIAERRGRRFIYFKDGAQICDVLAVMGAISSMMEYENSLILKNVKNVINRRVNCSNANMDKSMDAALKQIRDIMRIKETIGLVSLPDALAEVAKLRIENPEASMTELGRLLTPPVGKSGVSHRFKRLSEVSENLY